jgi:beta-lactam-binding protein with PASTA domain
VWVGNISGHQDLGRVWVKGGNANNVKFNIFRNTIASINKEYGGAAAFPKAPDALINGITQPVPSVTGQTVDQATSLLTSLGLRVKLGEPRASAIEKGRVAASNPGAGSRVSKGYQVTIYPSDGTLAAVMPDLFGNTAEQATKTLKDDGFTNTPSVVWKKVDPANAGNLCKVMATDPAAGSTTSKDASVTLTLASTEDGKSPESCDPKDIEK